MIPSPITSVFYVDILSLSVPMWILVILGFIIAFSITYLGIPIICKGAVYKGLFAVPNSRTSHNHPIPVMGGVAVFTGFIIATTIIAGSYFTFELSYLITGLFVIFIIGMKDDLMGGTAHKKFIGQILAVTIISVLSDVRINHLHGFLGIGDIPYGPSLLLTILVVLIIINGFNLIDGIDGLASGTGILISVILGIWFFLTKNVACMVMCTALAGALAAFFRFNVFIPEKKIFLGDTGSMTIGLVLGVLIVRFFQLEHYAIGLSVIEPAPAFALSIFIVPVFDTLRVFIIRISQGRSPFKADHQHIHHLLIECELSHLQATILLLTVNLSFVLLTYLLQDLGNVILIIIQLTLATLLSYLLLKMARKEISQSFNIK